MGLKRNLSKDNHGNIFYRKMIEGRTICIPVHTKDVGFANKLKKVIEYQALKKFYSPKEKTIFKTFREVCALYLSDENVKSALSKASFSTTKWVLNDYLKKKHLPPNKSSRVQYAGRLNTVQNWAKRNNYRTDVKNFETGSPLARRRVFNEMELLLILNKFPFENEFQQFLKFAYYTGARRGELSNIRPHHVESTRMVVYGKSGERFIKLNSQAKQILLSNPGLWVYKPEIITKTFKRGLRVLDIKNGRFHDLRRTFRLNLIKSGMPIYQVSKLLGHKSVKTTESHYAPLLIDDIEDFRI